LVALDWDAPSILVGQPSPVMVLGTYLY